MLKNWLKITGNLFFPRLCGSCQKKIKSGWLCLDCNSKLSFLCQPDCYSNFQINLPCRKQETIKAISACAYLNPLKTLIHDFKYRRRDYLAEFLAQLMVKQLEKIQFSLREYKLLIPVPLGPYKLKTRGYNQTELLAKYLANYFKLPLKSDIIASAYTRQAQVELDLKKRKENKQGKFFTKNKIAGLNVVLIDDVLTTGSTIAACSEALKESGAGKIIAITLAKQI